MRWMLTVSLAVCICGLVAPGVVPAIPRGTAKMLFCAYGGTSPIPQPTPPGFESEFAEVVVEINGATRLSDVAVSQFAVSSLSKRVMRLKRVISIERFLDASPRPDWGYATYYLSDDLSDKQYRWSGSLPRGTILLRIRMSVIAESHQSATESCSLSFGPYHIEGPRDAVWPTG